MKRERSHVTIMTSSRGGGSSSGDNVTQMTMPCLCASFCFLVCVTPSMILLIGKPYWNRPGTHWYAIAKSVTNQVPFCIHVPSLLPSLLLVTYTTKDFTSNNSAKAGGVMFSFVLSFCLPVILPISRITHDRGNGRWPNIVGMCKGWPFRSG